MAGRRTKADRARARRRLVLVLAVLVVAFGIVLALLPDPDAPPGPGPDAAGAEEGVARKAPAQREAARSEVDDRSRKPDPAAEPASTQARPRSARPRVAIVIDDVGHSLGPVEDLLQLDIPLTYAVIPHLGYSLDASRLLASRGQEVILHQPMEAQEYPAVPLEEGGLLVGMLPSEVERRLRENLESVPGALGVNNHKGSRATTDPNLMEAFLLAVKKRGLYFLDSRTSAETVAEATARRLSIPTARRHVFLDNEEDVESIHARLRELLERAEQQGEAIGIGHARPSMVWALETARPWLTDGRVELVPASQLVR